MVNFKNISDISLNQTEYCSLFDTQYYNNSRFRIKIPKLMTDVTTSMNDPFNKNILVNSNECKPSVDNSLYIQNYITIRKSPNCSLSHKVIDMEYNPYIPAGTMVTCLCVNENYKDMVIIDSV